jgi:hypothetical protein
VRAPPYHAAELDYRAVDSADDAAVMGGDGGVYQIATEPPEPRPGAILVRLRASAAIQISTKARLIAYPLASCLLCRKPIIAGQDWQEVSNGDTNARARFHRTCHAEWRTEREAAARQALGLEG